MSVKTWFVSLFSKWPPYWTQGGFALVLIIIATLSRLLPHAPNFSPINSIAVFAGAQFVSPLVAVAITLSSVFLSDIFLGFHDLMFVVYGALLVPVFIGTRLSRSAQPLQGVLATLGSGVVFFLVTNFAVWLHGSLYPRTPQGLLECFSLAVPFYKNTFLSDLFYSLTLFLILKYVRAAAAKFSHLTQTNSAY